MFKSPEPFSHTALGHLPTDVMLLVTTLASGAMVAVSFRPQLSVPITVYSSPVAKSGKTICLVPLAVPEYTSESAGLKTSIVKGAFPFLKEIFMLALPMVQDFDVVSLML